MTRSLLSFLAAAVVFAAVALPTEADAAELRTQDPRPIPEAPPVTEVPPAADAEDSPLVPLEVIVTISRHKDGKELSRMPYAIAVVANQGMPSSLRMGLSVPTPAVGSTSGSAPVIDYQSVEVNIDCTAESVGSRFRLTLSVNDDSLLPEPGGSTQPRTEPPAIRRFRSTNMLLLSDGESREFTAATDPVSGEVVRISVSLRVVK